MKNNNDTVYHLPEVPGAFIDAAVTDQFSNLIFVSVWGHTAALQKLMARVVEGSLKNITINDSYVAIDKEMTKKGGSLPTSNHYGDMTHLFLYRSETISDTKDTRDLIFMGDSSDELIFEAVRSLSFIPMLDSWKEQIVSILREQSMIVNLMNITGPVNGVRVNLGNHEDFADIVSQRIKAGQLTVDEVTRYA